MAGRASSIDWVCLDCAAVHAVCTGDIVSASAGGMPIYRVMAVENGRIWIRGDHDGSDRVAPLSHFHWKARNSDAPRSA